MLDILNELGVEIEKKRRYFWVNADWLEHPMHIDINQVKWLDVDAEEEETAILLAIIESKRKELNGKKEERHEFSFIDDTRFKETLQSLLLSFPMDVIIEISSSMKYWELKEYFMKDSTVFEQMIGN